MQLPGVDIPGAAVLYLYGSSLKCGRYTRPIAEMISGKSAKTDRITADKNGGDLFRTLNGSGKPPRIRSTFNNFYRSKDQ